MSESADEAEYAQETPDGEEEASEHGQDGVGVHDSTLLPMEADVKEGGDHRDSDGRCGKRDQHETHWWGPNSVFWCEGGRR